MGTRTLLKLPPIAPPAAISVVAPASFARQERIDNGTSRLQALGFAPRFLANATARGPLFFAGTPQQRIADLHAAFADPASQLLMSLRGGYGSNHILDLLDLNLIAAHPKPFFAYSDLTGPQLHLLDHLGLPAFHGPMLAADFFLENGVHLDSFYAALAGAAYTVGSAQGLRPIQAGTATGTLYGGCLSILVSLLGTRWEPDTTNKLLFLEDVGAKPYQIDRMLWQLRAAGKLQGVTGIVFGEMLDCASPGAEPDLLEKVLRSALADFKGPVALGLRSGHVSRDNVTLTFGAPATLRVGDDAQLEIANRN
ncbi:LD-carboxypeptidase [Acidobacteria bacterium AB60]|nr:LD-carboxypeptidase [Acidobacteria bacterium AB60]